MTLIDQLDDIDTDELRDAIKRLLVETNRRKSQPQSCPKCGYNMKRDIVIMRDGFTIDIMGGANSFVYKNKRIKLTSTQLRISHSIAKENGRTVEYATIADRSCRAETIDVPRLIQVHIYAIKKKLELAGAPNPFQISPGIGYFWSA
jgi:DNA-binding response OmpR family regulator